MNIETLLESNAVSKGLITLIEANNTYTLKTNNGDVIFDPSDNTDFFFNCVAKEIVFNTIIKERNLDKMYAIKNSIHNNENFLSLHDKDFEELRYGITSIKTKYLDKISTDEIENNFAFDQEVLLNHVELKGNFFAVQVYINLDLLIEKPNHIISYLNLTERQRFELGTKTLKKYGLYIEKRNTSLEEVEQQITTEKKGFVIPEIVKLKEIKNEHGIVKYYSDVSDAAIIPTSSAYPESLKNIRDVIPFLEGDTKKKSLTEKIMTTILEALNIRHDKNDDSYSAEYDKILVSIYGRIKELFSINNKTTVISNDKNKLDINGFDDKGKTVVVLSDSIALVDGQNSIDALGEISSMISAYLETLKDKDYDHKYESNPVYKKIIKAIEKSDMLSSSIIGIDQQIKEVRMIRDAINNHLIQIDLKLISESYEQSMDKIIESKNFSISISGTDNKLFEIQNIYPVLQNEVINSKKLSGLYLSYAKAQTPKYGNGVGINLGEVVYPFVSYNSKDRQSIQTARNIFKGKTFGKKDVDTLSGFVKKFKDTQEYTIEKNKATEKKKQSLALLVQEMNTTEDPDWDFNFESKKINDIFDKKIKELENREFVIEKANFKEFENFLAKYATTKEDYNRQFSKIKNKIDFKVQDKAIFEMFLATCFFKDQLGKTNLNIVQWAIDLNHFIHSNGGNLTSIRNNSISDDHYFTNMLNQLTL